MPENLLELEKLVVQRSSGVRLLRELELQLAPGEVMALAGESGCGKSLTALAIMGLLQQALMIGRGSSIRWQGRQLVGLDERQLRALRGGELALIPQNPMTALNPVRRVGSQMVHVIKTHRGVDRPRARIIALDALHALSISNVARVLERYPHQLSGGMAQRVLIAMAIACRPKLLIADEVTSALDVTTEAALLDSLTRLCRETGAALLLITHDLGIVARSCDRVAVMYCGRIVEHGPVQEVFQYPLHPYTAGLLAATPDLKGDPDVPLQTIEGQVPEPEHWPTGCAFAPRCRFAQTKCTLSEPPALVRQGRVCRCFFPRS